jgi:protein-S-isoprenylcysteine O-methyltransferase Ste14
MPYILLIAAWVVFGLLHSVLAYSGLKQVANNTFKSGYKYYRLLYSCFATISLTAVLWYHFSIQSKMLWQNTSVEKATAVAFSVPALIIMAISMKKYFADLSGIDVFFKRLPVDVHLEQTGLHKWVRHPLYSGTILLVWCIFLWHPSLSNLITAGCITAYTRIGVYYEEKKLVREFGSEYIEYAKKVPMLVPGL